MPTLTRENAEAKANEFGGLAIKRPSQQRERVGVCAMIYGQGGSGKTDTVSKVVALGKTLHIDVEGGTDVIEHIGDNPDYDIVEPESWKDITAVIDALKKDPKGPDGRRYENVILDNLSEGLERCERHVGIIGNDSHDLQKYKLVTMEVTKRVGELRTLARKFGINVFIIVWDADEKDERGVLKKDLSLTPKLREKLPGMINIVAHIRVLKDPDKRMFDMAPNPKSVAKFRRSHNATANKVPYQIEYKRNQPVLVDIIKSIKEGVDWPEKVYGKAKSEDD